jgi:hypothetical protein
MTVLDRNSDLFQQSTCLQLHVDKGPAAGGEALKYIYIYIYNLYIYIYIYISATVPLGTPGVTEP